LKAFEASVDCRKYAVLFLSSPPAPAVPGYATGGDEDEDEDEDENV